MPRSLADLMRAKPIRLRMPGEGLASWWQLNRIIRHFMATLIFRLEIDGAEEMSQTGDGLRFKYLGGSGGEETEEDTGWTDEDEDDCSICGDSPYLVAKKTIVCGKARCCGAAYTLDSPIVKNYSQATTTKTATLYDNTTGSLVLSPCTRTESVDYHVSGDGTATGPCSAGTPDCGSGTSSESGCDDAPPCSGIPNPGFKCYAVTATDTEYSKFCVWADLPAAALAAGESTEDEDFTTTEFDNLVGSSSGSYEGEANVSSWVIKRRGRRMPVHIIIEVTVSDVYGVDDDVVYEDEVFMPAGTSEGTYTLEMPTDAHYATITNVTTHFGRIP